MFSAQRARVSGAGAVLAASALALGGCGSSSDAAEPGGASVSVVVPIG